ncbi:uncharacterized protein LOC133923129 [Phragmites australis]|uniref:uncharacterized protein LOC133923129 n=1 Tax=Phragmites australis TaxID=29695 RepID=UPI002D78B341|nr:uncharacterized protein LOC133923129 [Phragmites australis]
MPRAGSSRRDKGSDSVLPESRIVNEQAAHRKSAVGTPRAAGRRPAAGTPREAGSRLAVGMLQAAAIRPLVGAPPAAEQKPQGTRGNAPGRIPPKDPAGGQRQPEELRPDPAPGPSAPAPKLSAPVDPEPPAPPYPEPRAAAAPEQPAPSETTPSTPRLEHVAAVEVVAARAASVWRSSGTLSASIEWARRGPSTRPPSSQAPEPLPDVLGSAQKVIEWLEAAVAAERAELNRDRATLVEERGWLEEVGRLLEVRIASARITHEGSMRAVAEEREAQE